MTMELIQAGDLVAEAEEQVPVSCGNGVEPGGDMMKKSTMIL